MQQRHSLVRLRIVVLPGFHLGAVAVASVGRGLLLVLRRRLRLLHKLLLRYLLRLLLQLLLLELGCTLHQPLVLLALRAKLCEGFLHRDRRPRRQAELATVDQPCCGVLPGRMHCVSSSMTEAL